MGVYDPDLASKGREIYTTLCVMCHGQNDSDIAPSLESIFERRTPEYIMNIMLNPTGMMRWHPSRSGERKYLTSMPYQALTTDDARAILEYLRGESFDVTKY